MKKTKKLDVKKFETLKTSGEVLKGGFSKSFSAVETKDAMGGCMNIGICVNKCMGPGKWKPCKPCKPCY
jgi:hypothetical protein